MKSSVIGVLMTDMVARSFVEEKVEGRGEIEEVEVRGKNRSGSFQCVKGRGVGNLIAGSAKTVPPSH